ncbi:MAG: hypothetical protein HY014_02920 [Acidobacteria bacterium]|nr:hypothetical protein [Acidobacteriota bacterium]MBI3487103.1 hypothetical protein [Acidobacteriota bacterium]
MGPDAARPLALARRLPSLGIPDLVFSALALLLAGLVACLFPALRVARVDPAKALRSE